MWSSPALAAPPSIDEPLRTGLRSELDAAVVVGIEDYAFTPDVPHARADAEAVRRWLLYTRGVPQAAIEALTDASREQILAAVERARTRVKPGGTLWVYVAGHGAASTRDGQRMVLGVDVMPDPEVFSARGVTLDELSPGVAGATTVVWLDACYDGATRTGAPLLPGARFAVPASALPARPDLVVWTAAAPGQASGVWAEAGHGAFTYVTVGALRGWADGELDGARDGAVTAAEAQAYATRRLAELGVNGQTPQLQGPGSTLLSPASPEAEAQPLALVGLAPSTSPLGPVFGPEVVGIGVLGPPGGGAGAVDLLGPPVDRPQRRADGWVVAGLATGAGAGLALGTTLLTGAAYRGAPLDGRELDGLYTLNRASGFSALGLGVAAAGLGLVAVLR